MDEFEAKQDLGHHYEGESGQLLCSFPQLLPEAMAQQEADFGGRERLDPDPGDGERK